MSANVSSQVGGVASFTDAQVAALQASVSGAGKSRSLKKMIPGRLVVFGNQQPTGGGIGSDSPIGTNWTTVLQMEMEAPFVAVRIWVPNVDTAAVATQTKVAVAVQQVAGAFGSAANIDYSAGDGLIAATFDNGIGSASTAGGNAIAAGIAACRPSWKPTDWIGIKSLPRTDGGTRPLLQVRIENVWVAANWKLTCPYIAATGWQDGVGAGGRLFRRFGQNVNGVTSPATFTDYTTAVGNKFCPVMVEYLLANGLGVQHHIITDSIGEGAGASNAWYGYQQRAIYELSTPTAPREYFNGGLHSQIPSTYASYALDMVGIVQPNVLHYQPYSINQITSDLSLSALQAYRQQLGRAVAAAQIYNPAVLTVAGLPCMDTSTYALPRRFKDYTNDARRLTFNSDMAGQASVAGRWYHADISTPLAGATNGSGQQLLLTTVTDDGVHPNDFGHDLAKVPLKAQIPAF